MRLPLVRSGDDETPIAWWEWLSAPIMMPLFVLVLLIMAVVSIPVEFVIRLIQQRKEKHLRQQLAAAGRFIEWGDVEAKLKAGEGTLIVEHCSPKGPIREWWTEADVVAAAPVPLPTSLKSLPAEGRLQRLQDFAKTCSARYVAIEAGSAKLTKIPIPLHKRLDPRKYVVVDLGGGLFTTILLVTGRTLSEKHPQGKVVMLLDWSDEPLLFHGDAEDVFLAPSEPSAPLSERAD
jgi:hypothetical protein